jgi:hypothetical protein
MKKPTSKRRVEREMLYVAALFDLDAAYRRVRRDATDQNWDRFNEAARRTRRVIARHLFGQEP